MLYVSSATLPKIHIDVTDRFNFLPEKQTYMFVVPFLFRRVYYMIVCFGIRINAYLAMKGYMLGMPILVIGRTKR